MTTFGYAPDTSGSVSDANSYSYAVKAMTPSDAGGASADSITWRVTIPSGGGSLKVGLYADNSGAPGVLLASGTAAFSAGRQWATVTFSVPYTLAASTPYWLACRANNAATYIEYDAATSNSGRNGTSYADFPASPFGAFTTIYTNTRLFYAYCTYSAGSTLISCADSGIGADSVAMSSVIPTSDTGAGADTPGISASLSVTDSGAGNDIPGMSASLSVTDSGAGNDIPGMSASLSVMDNGAGVDGTPGMSAQVPVTESGSGAETITMVARLTVSDEGSGLDAVDVSIDAILKAVTDSGVGSDVVSLNVALTVIDNGSGVDAVGIAVSVSATDEGTGADVLEVLIGMLIALEDYGTGNDTVSISAEITATDSGSGNEALTGMAMITVTDSGVGMDALDVIQTVYKTVVDSGVGVDAIGSISVTVPVVDSSIGNDVINLLASLMAQDIGHGLDVTTVLTKVAQTVTVVFQLTTPLVTTTVIPLGWDADLYPLNASYYAASYLAATEVMQLNCEITLEAAYGQ